MFIYLFFKNYIMVIYVGNLDYSIREEELIEYFRPFGEVASVKIITDKFSGRSKGFGFVEMQNDGEANSAIEQLNGTEIKGRKTTVNQSRERDESSRRSSNPRQSRGGYRQND
jgi:RNA recognition motif-containing protein